MCRLELSGYMTDLLLRDTDCMAMASALEVRVPFVDKYVVRHALNINGDWKLRRGIPKPLLLDSLRGAIPDYVWNRRKMGFVFPFERWMRSALRKDVEEVLSSADMSNRVGLDPLATRAVWTQFLEGRVRWSKPWSLFVLLKWCERHNMAV
jgi:asparagine synthase (glutamine-hydrolysing)